MPAGRCEAAGKDLSQRHGAPAGAVFSFEQVRIPRGGQPSLRCEAQIRPERDGLRWRPYGNDDEEDGFGR